MRRTPLLLGLVLIAASVATGPSSAQTSSATQIERYMRGEHDAVIAELERLDDYDRLLETLRRDAPAWIAAAPEDGRARRRLAAATFALEAARAADHVDWKWVRRLTAQGTKTEGVDENEGADRIFWKAPPLLIEWGCALLRSAPPQPIERIWHLAAVAVAQRAGDFEFLIGSPWDARMNPEDEIEHLNHVKGRTIKEPRFVLAAAIATEWRTWPAPRGGGWLRQQADAMSLFKGMTGDESVGAEALLRLGSLHARLLRTNDALAAFARVETATRDRYVIYLARYFKGVLLDRRGYTADAEAAYRSALAAIPQAQSATMALAALLARQGRATEAAALVEAQLSTHPQPVDPWRTYAAADDRFWPELIARLRAELQQ